MSQSLSGIGVQDVARHLKVSYSLLHLRFTELLHETPYEAILRLRLNEVRRRLRETRDTLETIAYACCWENATSLKNLFKRRFGRSMTDYRRAMGKSRARLRTASAAGSTSSMSP